MQNLFLNIEHLKEHDSNKPICGINLHIILHK